MMPVILMRSLKRELILARQNFYMEQVKVRVLGNFHNMEEEATQFGDKVFGQSEDDDSKYWDAAEFYMLLRDMKTQTTLGALASLYHQWEKEFRDFMENELSRSYGRAKITNCVWKSEIKEIFSKLEKFGWPIRQAQWFSLLNACRLIVNVYKHGKARHSKNWGETIRNISVSVRKVIESYESDVIQGWPWQIEDEADVDSRKPRLL